MTKDHTSDTPGTPSMTQQPPDVAFSAFHQMNRPEYVRYAETLLHDRHDAEEATDSAFEQLCRKWDQVLPKETRPPPPGPSCATTSSITPGPVTAALRRSTTPRSTPLPCAMRSIRWDRSPKHSPSCGPYVSSPNASMT
ncbi:hypothetical protein [Streptomyces sp. NPDC002164]|uniref:hypothetical protein n=1 Tax=Streptomyces sp. NPDC002164 TaxID=3364633 RepID=UPI00367D19F6